MAAVTLTVRVPSRSAATSFVDSHQDITDADTVSCPNDGRTILICDAAGGANVTVSTPNTLDGQAIAERVLAAGTAKMAIMGPYPVTTYGSTLAITVSANTDMMAVSLA